ncbi:MAG: V-type ATPase 116kDa subunit family protein [Oscillospiraceae bacterium]|nr:V-type ATPase 116kDa subunit family protein [Oscillospiraceae bacterium]MDD3832852.1 V-type ATPase 116kDa subunit family protein [Oscillospiraceae bacterium]
MAISKMLLFNINGQMNSLDATIFACGKTGVSQPDDTLSFFSDTSDFNTLKEENPFTNSLSKMETAISRAGGEIKEIEVEISPDTDKDALFKYVDDFSERITDLTNQRIAAAMRVDELKKECEQFEHFFGLGIDLDDILACTMIKVRFGRLPRESFEKLKMYDANPYVLFFPGGKDESYYWGVYFAPLDFANEIDRVFSGLYFERLRIPSAVGTPEEIVANLGKKREEAEREYEMLDRQVNKTRLEEKVKYLKVYSQLRQLSYYFSARRFAAKYNDKFILIGWIPARDEKKFRLALNSVDAIEYSIESAGSDTHHTPPIELRNPSLLKPFEFFVDMYGLPRYNEIDPTIFMAFTYTILFGIMFADLGQGICLAIIGWLMWKLKKMAIGKILIPCGISASVFGTVFGSVFGFEHILDPLYKAVLGLDEKPIEVMKPSMTSSILLASAGIGLVLIIAAMLLNIYSCIKRHDYENGLFGSNGIAGLVFYSSLVFGLIGQLSGAFLMTRLYVIPLIILPLVLVYLREPLGRLAAGEEKWQPESWGEYLLQNFFELFEMLLSYLSNTMSFLRVGAFVLVHSGMMMAVFTLAGLTSGIWYAVIIIVGNIIVMAMEALLVAIQVMRLEFYEMFSRYYKGDGRPYTPLNSMSKEKVFSERN